MTYTEMQTQFYLNLQSGFDWLLLVIVGYFVLLVLKEFLKIKTIKKIIVFSLLLVPVLIIEGINLFTHH